MSYCHLVVIPRRPSNVVTRRGERAPGVSPVDFGTERAVEVVIRLSERGIVATAIVICDCLQGAGARRSRGKVADKAAPPYPAAPPPPPSSSSSAPTTGMEDDNVNSIMSSALVQRSTEDTGVLVYTHAVIKHRPRPTGEAPFTVPPRSGVTSHQQQEDSKESKFTWQHKRHLQATGAARETQRGEAAARNPSASHAGDVLRSEIIRLNERVSSLEGLLRQAHESLEQAGKAEKLLATKKNSLHKQLEETQGALERRCGVEQRLREAERAAAMLQKEKEELEQRGRQQQQTIERLHRELQAARSDAPRAPAPLAGGSGRGDPGPELERALQEKSKLQEMVDNLTVELEDETHERETLALQTRRLERRVGELEAELEKATTERDATLKQHKQLEDRNKELATEYAEQCQNLDLTMEKVNRLREQKHELTAQLEQMCVDTEGLKTDNAALERQNDELRGRLSELESLDRGAERDALLPELEGRLRQLEAHLVAAEREKLGLQAEGRKLDENLLGVRRQLEAERKQTNNEREEVKQQLCALKHQGQESERQLQRALATNKQLQRELTKQRSANGGRRAEVDAGVRQDARLAAGNQPGSPLHSPTSSRCPSDAAAAAAAATATAADPYAIDDSDLPVAVF